MALVQIQETPKWKKLLSFIGPGFLVSVAYLDPGNLETDLQAGAEHKYELLWIVLVGLSFALIIQSRSVNLGTATVIGTAFALNILFHIPIWGGVLLSGLNTLHLLGLQRYGIRKLEIVIGILVLVEGGCFCSVMIKAKPDSKSILTGMFVPKLSSHGATRDAIALLGALIMPHNLFLHSALVISRKIPQSFNGIKSVCKFFIMECSLALFIAFLINVAVISVTGSVCSNLSVNNTHCKNITLNSAAFLLKNTLGNWSSKLYNISLLASGQSSTVTGTYAGQYIMQGFLDLKLKLWLRNFLTRCIAIAPSLVVSIIGGTSGASRLIIIASMILSFELPFALVPLLRFTCSETKMGYHKNSMLVTLISWLLGVSLIGINLYFLTTSLMEWITSEKMPKALSILAGLLVFPIMMLYIVILAYLTFKTETMAAGSQELATNTATRTDGNGVDGSSNLSSTQTINEIEVEDIICT